PPPPPPPPPVFHISDVLLSPLFFLLSPPPPSALALTSLWCQVFRLLLSPECVQPQSRSVEGNIATAVGLGLDELMRHVTILRPSCISALVNAMKEVSA
ncbi:unnamed protein product, partial [Discosporangium mesarthrocarpum]